MEPGSERRDPGEAPFRRRGRRALFAAVHVRPLPVRMPRRGRTSRDCRPGSRLRGGEAHVAAFCADRGQRRVAARDLFEGFRSSRSRRQTPVTRRRRRRRRRSVPSPETTASWAYSACCASSLPPSAPAETSVIGAEHVGARAGGHQRGARRGTATSSAGTGRAAAPAGEARLIARSPTGRTTAPLPSCRAHATVTR